METLREKILTLLTEEGWRTRNGRWWNINDDPAANTCSLEAMLIRVLDPDPNNIPF